MDIDTNGDGDGHGPNVNERIRKSPEFCLFGEIPRADPRKETKTQNQSRKLVGVRRYDSGGVDECKVAGHETVSVPACPRDDVIGRGGLG